MSTFLVIQNYSIVTLWFIFGLFKKNILNNGLKDHTNIFTYFSYLIWCNLV